MKKRLFLILGLLLALAITAISFASTSGTTTVGVTVGTNSLGVEAVSGTVKGKHTVSPTWSPTAGTTGTITQKGDLFVVTADSSADIWVTLYLNNSDTLSKAYSYLNLNIAAYQKTGTAAWAETPEVINSYLTLTNGYVSFKLTGHSAGDKYSIGVDGGNFYTLDTGTAANLQPSFYIEIN